MLTALDADACDSTVRCKRSGSDTDLSGLDLTRREVIAALILNYCGW